jgi:arylsulfatase A-like enzyme
LIPQNLPLERQALVRNLRVPRLPGSPAFVVALPLVVALIMSGFSARLTADDPAPPRPNVLVILADDLGYSDLGCYGGEIETPHLDALAAGGLRYTSFYNTARCWPTRAALLTGYYAQQVRRDALPTVPGGGARSQRPVWAPLLPHRLRPAGYRSYYSGKWHLDGTPAAGGFDLSYELMDQGRYFRATRHQKNGQELPATDDSDGYYSTVAIADHAIEQLSQHAGSHSAQPFFQYVAFTAPHFPLQALPKDIRKYADRYRVGWEVLRQQRWDRMRSTGLLSGSLSSVERTLGPPYAFPDDIKALGAGEVNLPLLWEELTEEQQNFQATKMAIHAAMIDRMDQEIGRILSQLREMNASENTLILFLSDNGASAEIMVRSDGHDPAAPMGSAATHLCLGPGWSSVSNTPFRRHKTWVHEGGISTPLIVNWPAGISEQGQFRRGAGHVIDIVPTILELAGVPSTEPTQDTSAPHLPGHSLVPSFSNDTPTPHQSLWWLHEGNRALLMGNWKLVAAKDQPWELYDLTTDRAEQQDLADVKPDVLETLQTEWDRLTNEFTLMAQRNPMPESASPNGRRKQKKSSAE